MKVIVKYISIIIFIFYITQNSNSATPSILLVYPPDDSKDIIDQPLIFRWTSGDNPYKYRIYIDDDPGFFNPLFVSESDNTTFVYPQKPFDQRHKLSSNQVYYWKVEGIDAYGNVISQSVKPFSFSLKLSINTTKDIMLSKILLGSISPNIIFKVETKNLGSIAEYNLNIRLYIDGKLYGNKTLEVIEPNELKYVSFIVDMSEFVISEKKFILTATIDFFDDNLNNNTVTEIITLPEEYFEKVFSKISGKVIEKINEADKKTYGIPNATVFYSGQISGSVISDNEGNYSINKLPPGKYTLKVACKGYKYSQEKEVIVEKNMTYDNIDFQLYKKQPMKISGQEPKFNSGTEEEQFSLQFFFKKLKSFLPNDVNIQIQGYDIDEIEGISPIEKDLNQLIEQIEMKKIKIIKIELQ